MPADAATIPVDMDVAIGRSRDIHMAQLDGLSVVRSKIHGYGLLALREFKTGDVVCVADGVMWRDGEEFDDTYCLLLPGYVEHADGTVTEDGPAMFLDLADQTRWINHTCEPNIDVDSRWDSERHCIVAWFIAIRDIAIGEELAYDYGFAAEVAEPCFCGLASCRGVIVDCDDVEVKNLSPELRSRLRGSLALGSRSVDPAL